MKTYISICLLLLSFNLMAQTPKELQDKMTSQYEAHYDMDFEGIADHLYPRMFEIIKRDQLLMQLDQQFQNPQMRIRLVIPEPQFKFGEIQKKGEHEFCVIRYPSALRMIFEEPLSITESRTLSENIRQSMPGKKVSFESKRNGFFIEGTDTTVAVRDNFTQGEWKFINYDTKQKKLLEIWFGEGIVEQLGL